MDITEGTRLHQLLCVQLLFADGPSLIQVNQDPEELGLLLVQLQRTRESLYAFRGEIPLAFDDKLQEVWGTKAGLLRKIAIRELGLGLLVELVEVPQIGPVVIVFKNYNFLHNKITDLSKSDDGSRA